MAILAVAKANNLDLEVVETDTVNPTPEYLKLNKLSKIPTFVGEDGYVLTECIAIAIYSMPIFCFCFYPFYPFFYLLMESAPRLKTTGYFY